MNFLFEIMWHVTYEYYHRRVFGNFSTLLKTYYWGMWWGAPYTFPLVETELHGKILTQMEGQSPTPSKKI
jgi:hypothetical protein